MNRKLVVVYEGGKVLGEAELQAGEGGGFLGDQIKDVRISHYSQPSERCPPLAVFHTINSTGICFKLESAAKTMDSPLSLMHATCLKENKTAVLSVGGVEVHLVAMKSRKYDEACSCFWGFSVPSGLYNSCLAMLNMRCLGIVFDLDETLIVANTLRSFEDRIDSLQRKMSSESDPQRISTMAAEVKRYQEDKNILKQYAETDQIIDNGKVFKAQSEVVLAMSDDQQTIVRPLIRLQDRNIILTRINPLIRDTSVLVRLRPAWEDLRSYLTAKGRKRFEVFVCTMAEGDYALEMWRLLDPESNLINPRDLLSRIVCVKAGSRKSLVNVFQDGICLPKMALVIDDRVKVWDEIDQPRVHTVPAFTPYSAPQAEANSETPVLCVARNVACNVRGGFFKEFDDGLMPRISEVAFEDDAKDIPPPPDVSSYLVSEDDHSVSTGVKDGLGFDGVVDNEVEKRLKEVLSASALPAQILSLDPRIASAIQLAYSSSSFPVIPPKVQGQDMAPPSQQLQHVAKVLKPPLPQPAIAESVLHGSPAREEGEVPESELDPDTRRRLLILQHGQDTREPPAPSEGQFSGRLPMQVNLPRASPPGWFPVEEEMSPRQLNRRAPSVEFNGETIPDGRHWSHHAPFLHKDDALLLPGRPHENVRLSREELSRGDMLRLNQSSPEFHQFSRGEESTVAKLSVGKILASKSGQIDPAIETFSGALQEIAFQCGTKVEFKPSLVSSIELQFSVEVFFAGQKIGKAIGNTRREAQNHAAEEAVFYLARKYLSQSKSDVVHAPESQSKIGNSDFTGDATRGYQLFSKETSVPSTSMHDASRKSVGFISALKEVCMIEGFDVDFQIRPHFPVNRGQKNEAYVEVEVNGQVLGKGIGASWEDAKSQAAEKALAALRSILAQPSYKRQGSPRPMHQGNPSKRSKPEFSRGLPQLSTSLRHPRPS